MMRLLTMLAACLLLATAPAFAEAPQGAQDVRLQTSDGHSIAGWFFPGTTPASPAVILLHMRGSDKSAWGDLPQKLVAEGYAALAIDLRGHGESLFPNGSNPGYQALQDADYIEMLRDIQAAHKFLEEQPSADAERVGIVGASIGANLGIIYASGDLRVRTVVALSAGEEYRGISPAQFLEGYGRRPLYLVCSKTDQYAHESSVKLDELATKSDPVSLRIFPDGGHGTELLEDHPGLDDTIVSGWFLNYLAPKR